MDASLPATDWAAAVQGLCALLADHKAEDVIALDMRELGFWTDYFIIATVNSAAHRDGLVRHVKEYAADAGLDMRTGGGKSSAESGWSLLDLGLAVVHLMSADARSFYELERLWSQATAVYSSKSSS
jgi:ribosome-associated protein